MRTTFWCLCLVLALSCSQGGPVYRGARVLDAYSYSDGFGNYEFGFRQSDNIYRWEKGELRYLGDQPFVSVTGGFAFLNDQNQVLLVTNFVADENGYQPEMSPGPAGLPPRFGGGAIGQG